MDLRAKTIRALRAAADALEQGEMPHRIRPIACYRDDTEWVESLEEVQSIAAEALDSDDDEPNLTLDQTEWGVFVSVEWGRRVGATSRVQFAEALGVHVTEIVP